MAGTIAIDVGGTLTDITFADATSGESWVGQDDAGAARAAIDSRVARPLKLGLDEAAAGIEIADNNMARAIRTVSVGRGHDPRR